MVRAYGDQRWPLRLDAAFKNRQPATIHVAGGGVDLRLIGGVQPWPTKAIDIVRTRDVRLYGAIGRQSQVSRIINSIA